MSGDRVISADKMMNRAKGPVWHKKLKDQGVMPKRLRGVDRDATWATSKADGWIYGHGTFSLVSHKHPVLGCFMWMPNKANEAKRMWLETGHLKGLVDAVAMDSKADDYPMFREFWRQRRIRLVTKCRKAMLVSENRTKMQQVMLLPENRRIYRERGFRVEPMQGLVKDIFSLDRCWMRGDKSNRWIFAAMGIAVQMHQLRAFHENRSTWKIKSEVLG